MAGLIISRRPLLALVGGTMAQRVTNIAPALAQAPPNFYALAPDWTINWQVHKTSDAATITQIEGGVRIDTADTPADADATQVALWAKRIQSGNFEFRYTYKVVSRVAVTGGSFGTFYFNVLGRGTTLRPKDVSSWQNFTPSDVGYATDARGLRFSFATFNPQDPSIDERLRLRYFNFNPALQLVSQQSAAVFPFTTGVAHNVRVRRVGQKLTIAVTPAAGGATQTYALTDKRIGQWTGGYVGFRIRGQDAEITNTSLVKV